MVEVTGNLKPPEVTADWDPEAEVWVAVSDLVPGLVAEADSMDELITTLETLIPQLLKDNRTPGATGQTVDYNVTARMKKPVTAGV